MPSRADCRYRETSVIYSLGPTDGASLGIFRESAFCLNCRMRHLRHLFALHMLRRWYRDGEHLDAKLPLLATYLGHQHLSGTQRYLRLTAEIFPEIAARVNAAFGEVIPRRIER